MSDRHEVSNSPRRPSATPRSATPGAAFGARVRAFVLLAASYAFVSVATVVTHEAGHWIADGVRGASVRVVAPWFGAPHIEFLAPFAGSLLGWPDAAGPLLNVLVGGILFVALWRLRRPALVPLLLWAPVALLQEGVNALVQLGTRAPGTDHVRLVAAGVPAWILTALAIGAVLGGLAMLTALLPCIERPVPFGAAGRFALLLVGFAAYPGLGLILSAFVPASSVTRNATLLAFALIVAGLVTAARALLDRVRRGAPAPPGTSGGPPEPWPAIGLAVAAAILVHLVTLPLA